MIQGHFVYRSKARMPLFDFFWVNNTNLYRTIHQLSRRVSQIVSVICVNIATYQISPKPASLDNILGVDSMGLASTSLTQLALRYDAYSV